MSQRSTFAPRRARPPVSALIVFAVLAAAVLTQRVPAGAQTGGSTPVPVTVFVLLTGTPPTATLTPGPTDTPVPPTPTPSPTPTPPPTATPSPTPLPSIMISGLDLLRRGSASVKKSCVAALGAASGLASTPVLFPGQVGVLRVLYQASNPGANKPEGHVLYLLGDRVIDGNLLATGSGRAGQYFCTPVLIKHTGVHQYVAHVVVRLGLAADTADLSFSVGRCQHGATGPQGTCVSCRKGYILRRGHCRRT